MKAIPTRRLIPVIHCHNLDQVLANASIASEAEVFGVFLISMDGRDQWLSGAARAVRDRFPALRVGLNRLQSTATNALSNDLQDGIQMSWADRSGVTSQDIHPDASVIARALTAAPLHEFFGSVAFKYQQTEVYPGTAAVFAAGLGMIPTTSGPATGKAAGVGKLAAMRGCLGPGPRLALASGVTPDNIGDYLETVTDFLVATGISLDFHHFDATKMIQAADAVRAYNANLT